MEYKRKLLTMPTKLANRLAKEGNQSATTVEALQRYFEGRDGLKTITKLAQDNTDAMNDLAEAVQEMQQLQKKVIRWMNEQGASI